MSAEERARARRRGRRAETVAAWLLRLKGYRILARGFSCRGGEIDIIAGRGATIAFVEVKARDRLGDAADAITATKRRRIDRAARLWLAAHPEAAGKPLRFDAVLVTKGGFPEHIADAWRP